MTTKKNHHFKEPIEYIYDLSVIILGMQQKYIAANKENQDAEMLIKKLVKVRAGLQEIVFLHAELNYLVTQLQKQNSELYAKLIEQNERIKTLENIDKL